MNIENLLAIFSCCDPNHLQISCHVLTTQDKTVQIWKISVSSLFAVLLSLCFSYRAMEWTRTMTRRSTSAAVSTTGRSYVHCWKGSKISIVYRNLSTPFSYTFQPKTFRLLHLQLEFIISVQNMCKCVVYTFLTMSLINIYSRC